MTGLRLPQLLNVTYALLTESMDDAERKEFDLFLNADPDEILPPDFQYGRAAEKAAALAHREAAQQESNVEGLLAAFAMPQNPRGNYR